MERDILIGRSKLCQHRIKDIYASRQHAQLIHTDQETFIIDLNSNCGTTVNGQLIKPSTPKKLEKYDIIRTADTLIPWMDMIEGKVTSPVNPDKPETLSSTITPETVPDEPDVSNPPLIRLTEAIKAFFKTLFRN